MTRLYIDTEFNGFGGELISVALVAETGQEFYEFLECRDPEPWVAEHVMPFLCHGCSVDSISHQAIKQAISRGLLQHRLQEFLYQFIECTIIADWPDDIRYFCELLITGPGMALNHPPITFELNRKLSSDGSAVLHNALHDARAIMEDDLSRRYRQ